MELTPSLRVTSKRTAPQWHWPARTFASPAMLPGPPVQITLARCCAQWARRGFDHHSQTVKLSIRLDNFVKTPSFEGSFWDKGCDLIVMSSHGRSGLRCS